MLEARLITQLVHAQVYWELDYINDAQNYIKDAISMAADTPWEDRIEGISPEYVGNDQLKDMFLHNNPEATEDDLYNMHSKFYDVFSQVCWESGKQWSDHTKSGMACIIEELCNSIGDKVHRRNLQIADLKRQLEAANRELAHSK